MILTPEAWAEVEALTNASNENFDVGAITYSDVINEMVLTAKVDVKTLQRKHTDIRRSIRAIASQNTIDLDSAIKALMELKSLNSKRKPTAQSDEVSA